VVFLSPMQLTVQDAFALAARHEADGRAADARAIYEQILAALPEQPGALLRIARQELVSGRYAEAQPLLERALASARARSLPTQEIWEALAETCLVRGEREQARLALGELHGIAKTLKAAGSAKSAHELLERCVALAPDDADLRVSLGAVCLDCQRPADAKDHLERAAEMGATGGAVWDNLGLAYRMLGDDARAMLAFERAVAAEPSLTPALANLVNTRYTLCEWDGLEAHEQRLIATLDDPTSDPRWSPWIALSLPTSPAQQLAVARRWARAMLPAAAPRRPVPPRPERLRVGYLSGNFRDHPTGRLMAGLFEAHDRRRFEITGYSYGRDSGGAIGERVRSAFDRWRDVRDMSDAEVARTIRDDGIDVLVDRHGYTLGGRLAILAARPAPVQIHYMSFPGTLGYDAIDGVVGDAEVIPPGEEIFFHERVWRLPRCYYVNDRRRGLPVPTPRSANGLPEDALVLACLNQSHKLRRPLFAAWLAALRAQPGAVLWLLSGPPRLISNLRREAERGGVDPERLIFARALAQDAHIARLACADLALDTLPYGAHTTGCDALWTGVPMLTCRGSTFAGRVGASLLNAAGLQELIADSPEGYAARLLELVASPHRLREYRDYLERTRETNPLFDTIGFTRDWEALLVRIYDDAAARRGEGT
jgi:predicted O-linked N-acetylglucosamine transferase (SPINDLY family)